MAAHNQFDTEGWFDMGDVAHIDRHGYLQITDRANWNNWLIMARTRWVS